MDIERLCEEKLEIAMLEYYMTGPMQDMNWQLQPSFLSMFMVSASQQAKYFIWSCSRDHFVADYLSQAADVAEL